MVGGNGLSVGVRAFRREVCESCKDAIGARICSNWRNIAPGDRAFGIDRKQRALTDAVLLPVDTVLARHCTFRLEVSEQREVQVAVLGKRGVAPCAIDRNANELPLKAVELWQDLVVKRHLIPANGTPVRRVE